MARPELDAKDIAAIWSGWWDNLSLTEIMRYKLTRDDVKISDIRRVLSEPVPQALEADDRSLGLLHAILVLDRGGDIPADNNAMVFFQYPIRLPSSSWRTGIRSIARTLKARGAAIAIGVGAEQVETDVCSRMLAKGYLGFTIDANGTVTEGIRFPERSVEESALIPGP